MLSCLELNLRSIAPVAPLLVQGAGCHKNEVTNLVPNGVFYHISLQRGSWANVRTVLARWQQTG